jgi:hypothetical protein
VEHAVLAVDWSIAVVFVMLVTVGLVRWARRGGRSTALMGSEMVLLLRIGFASEQLPRHRIMLGGIVLHLRRECAWVVIVLLTAYGVALAGPSVGPVLGAQQMREDLVYLRDVWGPMDKSFGPQQRTQFEGIVNSAIARVDSLTPVEFSLEVTRAVAVSGNAHTEAELGPYFRALPFKAAWFSDGLYIVRTHPAYAALLGARIDRFGPLSAEEALRHVAPFISGTDAHIRVISPGYLRLLEVLQHVGATNSFNKVRLHLTLRNGKPQSVTLGEEPTHDPEGLPPSQQLIRLEGNGNPPDRWPDLLDDVHSVPSAYERYADLASEWIGVEGRVLYIRSNLIADSPGSSESFEIRTAKLLRDDVLKGKPNRVIVDLRLNNGGNFFNTIFFCQALPKLAPDAKVFVLVGPGTLSAALSTAAMLKGNGGSHVVLVGETMGDRPQFWSEGSQAPLPNSRILVRSASGYHDWANGCDDPSRCFWIDVAISKKNVALEPEIRVATTFGDYAAGRDSVLAAALAASDGVNRAISPQVSSAP